MQLNLLMLVVFIHTNIELYENKRWLLIAVKDTGIGMDKHHHNLIFDPFYRIESPETSQYPGIGLGLSNVVLMLKKINGKIFLESELKKGSIFKILLPLDS